MTATTVPISTAWTTARSPLSAKKSMKPTISTAVTKRTSHSGVGMTPDAPWIRAPRAASRSSRWSSHFA